MKFCPPVFLSAALLVTLAGCKKPAIRTYLAPKDPPPAPATAAAAAESATAEQTPARPRITYQLPAGWEEGTPNSVSVALLKIKSGDAEANVNIAPLANLAGREAVVMNIWRSQAGLPPLEEADVAKDLHPVAIGEGQGQMFEMAGTRENGAKMRMVTAFLHQPDASWFYHFSGDDTLVTAQKPAFLEFLKSVRVQSAPATPTPAPTATPTATDDASWNGTVPDGWTQVSPGNMQVAKFQVPAIENAKAEVAMSIFPNDTGGLLANVNRWRRQLGLPEVDQAALASSVTPLDPTLPDAVLIDLKNEARALLGAIVPREGRWWFYKMMGDAPAVAAAREQFVAFAKSAPTGEAAPAK